MFNEYNLIIMGNIENSTVSKTQSGIDNIPADRLFECTSDDIKSRYANQSLSPLAGLPTLILGEASPSGITRTPAFVSRISDIAKSGREISFRFDHIYDNLRSEEVYASRLFDIAIDGRSVTENFRTHWAVKQGDLFARVFELVKSREFESNPKYFNTSERPLSILGHVAVMMPFHANFNSVYEEIKVSCKELRLEAKRVDEIYKPGKVMDDIYALIAQSRVVICDLTGRNPNVLYEVGLAHALSREVIIVVQNEEDVPFDLRQFRFFKYSQDIEGLKALRTNLKRAIQEISH